MPTARISEVLALRPCDIDYENQRLVLPALKRKDIATKLVVVDPDTLDRLRSFCKGKSAGKKLFNMSRRETASLLQGKDGS